MLGPPTWAGSPERIMSRAAPLAQAAADGALDIFVDGHRHADASKMLFGLHLLQDASTAQIQSAIAFVGKRQHLAPIDIESMLAR